MSEFAKSAYYRFAAAGVGSALALTLAGCGGSNANDHKAAPTTEAKGKKLVACTALDYSTWKSTSVLGGAPTETLANALGVPVDQLDATSKVGPAMCVDAAPAGEINAGPVPAMVKDVSNDCVLFAVATEGGAPDPNKVYPKELVICHIGSVATS